MSSLSWLEEHSIYICQDIYTVSDCRLLLISNPCYTSASITILTVVLTGVTGAFSPSPCAENQQLVVKDGLQLLLKGCKPPGCHATFLLGQLLKVAG